MRSSSPLTSLLCTLGLALLSQPCLAGRPLTVDDANVNDVGAGHVEAWLARGAGAGNAWTIAPAYGLADGIEVAAALTRDTRARITATSVQARFRFTASRENGCNFGGVLGLSHASAGTGQAPYLNGLLSCNLSGGALHFNLGAVHPEGESTLRTWGMAHEREFGTITGHLEYFGQQGERPTVQVGLRGNVATQVQIDGTLGRTGGETVYSLGLKVTF